MKVTDSYGARTSEPTPTRRGRARQGGRGHRVLAVRLEGAREAGSPSSLGSPGRRRRARARRIADITPGAAWGLLLGVPEETGCRQDQALHRPGRCLRWRRSGRARVAVGERSAANPWGGERRGRSAVNPKGMEEWGAAGIGGPFGPNLSPAPKKTPTQGKHKKLTRAGVELATSLWPTGALTMSTILFPFTLSGHGTATR